MTIDVSANRRSQKYTTRELCKRVLWDLAWPAFRLSPRPLFVWRRIVLRAFGARVGGHVHISNTARISMPWNLEVGAWSAIGDRAIIYNLGPVRIGQRTTVSQGAHLCAGTHDHRRADFPLLKQPINVGDGAWICAEAFVGPDVEVGEGAVVGARAVVTKSVEPMSIVAGNPARVVGKRTVLPS